GGRRKAESCGAGTAGHRKAEKRKRQIEAELMTGTYQVQARRTWQEFLDRYRETLLAGKAPRSQDEAETSLAHFERLAKPGRPPLAPCEPARKAGAAHRDHGGDDRFLCGQAPPGARKEGRGFGLARHSEQGPSAYQGGARQGKEVGLARALTRVRDGTYAEEA